MNKPILNKHKKHEKITCLECGANITSIISSILYNGAKDHQENIEKTSAFLNHFNKKHCDGCLSRAYFSTRKWILSDWGVGWRTDRCIEIYKSTYGGK